MTDGVLLAGAAVRAAVRRLRVAAALLPAARRLRVVAAFLAAVRRFRVTAALRAADVPIGYSVGFMSPLNGRTGSSLRDATPAVTLEQESRNCELGDRSAGRPA
jgi:hypothetical protein